MSRIPTNATIRDICGTLLQPEEYVRKVLDNMASCQRNKKASATVRLGILGEGKAANYRVEYPSPDAGDGSPAIYALFKGLGHGKLAEDDAVLGRTTWSSETTTFAEVQALLGQQRNFKGGKRGDT
jgi:hypothetical protein